MKQLLFIDFGGWWWWVIVVQGTLFVRIKGVDFVN